jgi:hypothetical protein
MACGCGDTPAAIGSSSRAATAIRWVEYTCTARVAASNAGGPARQAATKHPFKLRVALDALSDAQSRSLGGLSSGAQVPLRAEDLDHSLVGSPLEDGFRGQVYLSTSTNLLDINSSPNLGTGVYLTLSLRAGESDNAPIVGSSHEWTELPARMTHEVALGLPARRPTLSTANMPAQTRDIAIMNVACSLSLSGETRLPPQARQRKKLSPQHR